MVKLPNYRTSKFLRLIIQVSGSFEQQQVSTVTDMNGKKSMEFANWMSGVARQNTDRDQRLSL